METTQAAAATETPISNRNDEKPLSSASLVTIRLSELHDPLDSPIDMQEPLGTSSRTVSVVSSSGTTSSDSDAESPVSPSVDWEQLERTEEIEAKDADTDESTALLLARLEQENAALATNPKTFSVKSPRTATRPPSIQHLKKLVDGPQRQSLRYSQMPAPAMTELEFWAALVADYTQTAQRLPTLTSNKIRGGVPPPLRGVVWPSIAGAKDLFLLEEYERLATETSPYEGLIGKDVGRSFPNVEMFREAGGEGQRMLGRVLKSFSLYDDKIGYCQGLGFVVGPLLMHMSDAEAFCVLVRLMEHYDLRSCYLPDLSGLHLRIYQFERLLTQHLPELAEHLEKLKVEHLYVSQWFLSFFAVTCPLPMLLRIYDVILSEGATETLMRVALSLMRRNQKKLMACTEFEDVMQSLLSRSIWDTYAQQADDLVADFVSLTSLVSRSTLQAMEEEYKEAQVAKAPSLRVAASQLLGRFWSGASHGASKSANNLSLALPSRPTSTLRRSPSKQSLTSTLNSVSSISDVSTLATDLSTLRKSDPVVSDSASQIERGSANHPDRDLHSQIEDLLMALSDMQREQATLAKDLQKEREEREEDKAIAKALLSKLKTQELALQEVLGEDSSSSDEETTNLFLRAESRLAEESSRRISIIQSKHQLRDSVVEWKGKHEVELARCKELMQRLDKQEQEHAQLKDQLREARARIQEGHKDSQRLERTIQDLKNRKPSVPNSPAESTFSAIEDAKDSNNTPAVGLREFKLGRMPTDMAKPQRFSKRTSSLSTQAVLSTENNAPASDDALLLELVNAKTAEAMAKQELEEVKGKLDSLRKMLNLPNGGSAANTPTHGTNPLSRTSTNASVTPTDHSPGALASLTNPGMAAASSVAATAASFFGGGQKSPMHADSPRGSSPGNTSSHGPSASASGSYFFSGWGKRSVSSVGL